MPSVSSLTNLHVLLWYMFTVSHRGSTRSGRQYFLGYLERFPKEVPPELIANLNKLATVDINTLFIGMVISPNVEKTLRELGLH